MTPPLDAPPPREKLRIEGAGFECAFGFVFRADGIDFSRIRSTQENFACRIAGDARDLRRAGLGEMGEDAMTIDGEESAAVAGPGKEAAIGSESESVNDIFARRPELFRCAVGADAVDAAGEKRRKRGEGLLGLELAGSDYAACGNGCRALRGGDDGAGRLSHALLFTDC